MKSILDRYLDRVLIYANKPKSEAEAIRHELKDHLLAKVGELVRKGVPRDEATLEALRQHGSPKVIGYRLRAAFPWIDIRSHGTARGVIAIGPRAVGVFAFGGMAVGVFACGTASVGLFSAGALSFGLIFAWAALGMGGIVNAGLAIGVVAAGGAAIGLVAAGNSGFAMGAWVPNEWKNPDVHSYFTAENVPSVLRSLESLLNAPYFMFRHFGIIIPIYILAIMLLVAVRYREGKRVHSKDDWLINS